MDQSQGFSRLNVHGQLRDGPTKESESKRGGLRRWRFWTRIDFDDDDMKSDVGGEEKENMGASY